MDKELRYNDFAGFLTRKFPFKVQKLSVNAGFTCPNRDGSKDVRIVTIRRLIPNIAVRKKQSVSSWRKANNSLPVNIRR